MKTEITKRGEQGLFEFDATSYKSNFPAKKPTEHTGFTFFRGQIPGAIYESLLIDGEAVLIEIIPSGKVHWKVGEKHKRWWASGNWNLNMVCAFGDEWKTETEISSKYPGNLKARAVAQMTENVKKHPLALRQKWSGARA